MLGKDEIEYRFGFHKETSEEPTLRKTHETRLKFREFAEWLDETLPETRAKAIAFTELETAALWCYKAITEKAPLIREDP